MVFTRSGLSGSPPASMAAISACACWSSVSGEQLLRKRENHQSRSIFRMLRMLLALGARMRLIVNNGQMLEIEMCINLRRGDAGVTEHFLYGTQITGCLQEMRGK